MTPRSDLHYSVNTESLSRSLEDELCSIGKIWSLSSVSFKHSLSGFQYNLIPDITNPIGEEIYTPQGMLQCSIITLASKLFQFPESGLLTYTIIYCMDPPVQKTFLFCCINLNHQLYNNFYLPYLLYGSIFLQSTLHPKRMIAVRSINDCFRCNTASYH